MENDPHKQESEWFSASRQDTSPEGRAWDLFEGELFRAIKQMESLGHAPVIRMSEKVFQTVLKGKYTSVIGACWSVYLFRGYPISLRNNSMGWDIVEVLDSAGHAACSFKVKS